MATGDRTWCNLGKVFQETQVKLSRSKKGAVLKYSQKNQKNELKHVQGTCC